MNPTRRQLRSPSERVGTLLHADIPPPAAVPYHDEPSLLRALRRRDEAAFAWLLDRYYAPMIRLARTYVRTGTEAEEVVQDTWLAVVAGLDRFEGRSSLRTWVFRILVNRARSRATRESRQIPFSSLRSPAAETDGGSAVPEWLFPAGGSGPHYWEGEPWAPPRPDTALLASELREQIEAAIGGLAPRQKAVITLRDVEGWSADEVSALLDVSDGNQRVLLHRARLRVRDALEAYLADAPSP